jgi:hypothetical protein
MAQIIRKVVSRSIGYGPRGGEYRLLLLECGHTVERHSRRVYPSQEEECRRCSNPWLYFSEFGLPPTQEDVIRRLYFDGPIEKSTVSGSELRALNALVAKGFVVEVESVAEIGSHFKLIEPTELIKLIS